MLHIPRNWMSNNWLNECYCIGIFFKKGKYFLFSSCVLQQTIIHSIFSESIKVLNFWFLFSLVLTLSSRHFLKWKHRYLSENILIFHSNDDFFTQSLFLKEKRCHLITFSWQLESKRTTGKRNHKFRGLGNTQI